jgi:cytochrome P450
MTRPWISLPEDRGRFLIGSLAAFRAAPHRFPMDLAEHYGGMARFHILGRRFLAVTDPDAIAAILNQPDVFVRGAQYRNIQEVVGRGLLVTDGALWRERRPLLNPLFRADRLRQVIAITQSAMQGLLDEWEQAGARGDTVEIGRAARTLTITVMARTLLSHDLEADQIERLSQLIHTSMQRMRERNISLWNPPFWVPVRRNRDLQTASRFLRDLLAVEIGSPQAGQNGGRDNLLAALASLREAATGQPLSSAALIDELRSLFVAGFETTSAALAWTVWRLAKHPEWARLWQAEVDALPTSGPFTLDQLKKLPRTEQILQESLRLHPPVYTLSRVAQRDTEVGGYRIPRGTMAIVSIYGLHRSPRFWADPLAFRPERFATANPNPQHWIPFGAGPHLCIGMAFALLELKTALTMLGQRFRLTLVDDRDPEERAEISLSPGSAIPLRLEPR